MASVYASEDVEPKPSKIEATKTEKMDDLKKKAFISPILPEDFLRILLDQRQIAENKDSQLAHQLQYGGNSPMGGGGGGLPMFNAYGGQILREPIDFGRGRLQVDVIEAKLNKNYGWITRMDPYVRLKIGPRMFETPTSYNGNKNPIWKKSIVCYLPRNVDSIVFEIYDEKSFSEDEMIAFVKFPLPQSLFDGIFLNEWIPLNGKLGEQKEGYINIRMLFTPLEEMSQQLPRGVTQPLPNYNNSSVPTTSPSSSASSNLSNNSDQVVQPSQVQIASDLSTLDTNQVTLTTTTSTTPSANSAPLSGPVSTNLAMTNETAAASPYTEEDLNAIKEMFPHFDGEVIKSILELNRGNKEASIEALLQMNQ